MLRHDAQGLLLRVVAAGTTGVVTNVSTAGAHHAAIQRDSLTQKHGRRRCSAGEAGYAGESLACSALDWQSPSLGALDCARV